jgi:hypothetical protein
MKRQLDYTLFKSNFGIPKGIRLIFKSVTYRE